MSYRNNPHVQARIFQARQKKQNELRQTANVFYIRGAKAAAEVAKDIVGDPAAEIYELDTVIMWKLKLLVHGRRILKGSDMTKDLDMLIEEAKKSLNGSKLDTDLISASVNAGRSEFEAWEIHERLAGIAEDDLSAEIRGQMSARVALRFPSQIEDSEDEK